MTETQKYPGFDPSGDVTPQDWLDEIGVTKEEFAEPVAAFFQQCDKNGGRDLYLCDEFLRVAGTPETRNLDGVNAFYSGDYYARLLAYETPESNIIAGAIAAAATIDEGEAEIIMLQTVADKTNGRFRFLDHGCGLGRLGIYILAKYPNCEVVLYDFNTPVRRIIAKALTRSIVNPERCICRWEAPSWASLSEDGPFDFVYSVEVLEHVPDPIAELHRIRDVMKPDALLFLGTFFNSIYGRNPTHLEELAHYQDGPLWFGDVHAVGFEDYLNDPRGVLKGFRKV